MKRICLWLGSIGIFFCNGLQAQQDTIAQRIILVGDAGKLDPSGKHPELELLRSIFHLDDGHTAVLFLGDNVYQQGLPDAEAANYAEKKKILDDQVDVVKGTKAEAWFIPGNHDWRKGRKDGFEQIQHQSKYIASLQLPNVHFAPMDGCPGPVEVPLNANVVLLIIDSQWWFQREGRPGTSSDCDCKSEDELAIAIKDALYRNRNKLVLFASHHPFRTHGEHGGYYTFKQHLFPLTEVNPHLYIPLPLIGSIYPLSRSLFGNIQDLPHPVYKSYIQKIDTLLDKHPYCIRVAGHEHTLQFMEEKEQYHIVSGAGSKTSQVRHGKDTKFAHEGTGFSVLEISVNGSVSLRFYSSRATNNQQPVYAAQLKKFVSPGIDLIKPVAPHLPDSATSIAATYYKAGAFKRWLLGKNYREEWTTPVRVPVFDIGKEKGGLTPTQRGGGMQSKSLRLEDANGNEYVIRSIQKDVAKTLPEDFRQTFAQDIVLDGISASYPYAALSVPSLATAAGVPHANPRLVFVPDDPRLLQYRSDFANSLCLFEERAPAEVPKTYSTLKVIDKLQEDNDNLVDEKAVLRARILDMFIMDFDRHDDQWRWGATDNGKGKTYYPIPRDRDQVFFINNGVIPHMVSQPWMLPKFQGFRPKARNMDGLFFNARYFDRSFLAGLSEKDWADAVDAFLPQMTDSIIDAAMQQQPKEIRLEAAPWIAQTLRERKQFLKGDALKYYKFLAREADITGSDKKELFDVARNSDGSVLVVVYKITKDGDQGHKMFERRFVYGETKEIRLWGMGGADQFLFHGDARKTICVRVIGGKGKDHYENQDTQSPAAKTKIYDLNTEKNTITGPGSFANRMSSDPSVNTYDRKAYKYNILAPLVSAAYNPDDGVFLGLGLKYTGHSFRRSPSVVHKLLVNHALATKAFSIRYSSDFRRVIGKSDIYLFANLHAPNYVSNFFGLGNETVYNKQAPGKIKYYRARYNQGDMGVLLKREFNSWLSLGIGPAFQYYSPEEEDNQGRFLAATNINGLDSATLFKDKFYLGGQFNLIIDNRDNIVAPTRGIHWATTLKVLKGLNDYSKTLTQLSSDMSLFLSFNSAAGLVIATRFGGGVNFGDYEFFQAQYLGNTENLRGFRRSRFAGRSMLFNNTELRIKVADFKTYLFPGTIGLIAFNDVGRVWVKNDRSSVWHHGYGGGLSLSLVNRFVLAASLTASTEGTLPLLTFGYQF